MTLLTAATATTIPVIPISARSASVGPGDGKNPEANLTANIGPGLLFAALEAITIPEDVDILLTTGFGAEGVGGAFYLRWKTGMSALHPAQEAYSWGKDANGAGFFLNPEQWVTPFMFGAVNDEGFTIDQTVIIQKFWDWYDLHPNAPINTTVAAGIRASATNAGPIVVIGPENEPSAKPARTIMGDHWLRVIPDSPPATVIVRVRNMTRTTWHGGIRGEGPAGASSFAQRLNHAVGIEFANCARLYFTGVCRGDRCWFAGIAAAVPNNNLLEFRHIWATDNGSGHDRGSPGVRSLVGNWSNPINSGSAGSSGQRTTLSVTAFPPNSSGKDAEKYMDPTESLYQLRLEGDPRLYQVKAWNPAAGTVEIYPWIEPRLGSTGACEWVFGGGWICRSGDGQIVVGGGTLTDNGNGFWIGAQYAAKAHNQITTSCGTGGVIGREGSSATCMGVELTGFYCENNTRDLCFVTQPGAVAYGHVASEVNLDRDKIFELSQPRDGSGVVGEVFSTRAGGWRINLQGRPLNAMPVDVSSATAYTLALLDRGCLKRLVARSAIIVTVPARSAVNFMGGDFVDFEQSSTGTITFAAAEGVTIRSRGGLLASNGPYSRLRLQKIAEPDIWLLSGDLA